MDTESKIITINELIESNKRKEKELQYYRERLEYLEHRVSLLQGDINLTNKIIHLIEQENIVEVKPK